MNIFIINIKRYFLKFSVVGVLNTGIHMAIYNMVLFVSISVVASQLIAFCVASVFSYFANSKFTYNKSFERITFFLVMVTFAVKLILNGGLAYTFEYIFLYQEVSFFLPIIPLFITAILLPIQFVIFNMIFKANKEVIV